jgi:hypothetical protein
MSWQTQYKRSLMTADDVLRLVRRADYTPIHLSEVEGLFESGAMRWMCVPTRSDPKFRQELYEYRE